MHPLQTLMAYFLVVGVAVFSSLAKSRVHWRSKWEESMCYHTTGR